MKKRSANKEVVDAQLAKYERMLPTSTDSR